MSLCITPASTLYSFIGTDVAGEMELFVDTLKECKVCYKAGVAAVEMLAVSVIFVHLNSLGICFDRCAHPNCSSTCATGFPGRFNAQRDLPRRTSSHGDPLELCKGQHIPHIHRTGTEHYITSGYFSDESQ